MHIENLIQNFIATANAHDTKAFLENWHADAVLNDPSVGEVFNGHAGIQNYFEDYFIGYKTQTKLLKLDILHENTAQILVEFTGNFPGNKTDGTFDFQFKDGKITFAKADLI